MTDKAISPLRQRLIDDMMIRRLGPKTQQDYIRHVKHFALFFDRSPDTATAEDVRRYQLRLASIGTTVPSTNAIASALRFFFKVTLKRSDLADEVVSAREPRRLPVVLSPQEVGRLLASAANIKHKAALSLAYATGLRASEVISVPPADPLSSAASLPPPTVLRGSPPSTARPVPICPPGYPLSPDYGWLRPAEERFTSRNRRR
jgi:integrase/recombinase XerD